MVAIHKHSQIVNFDHGRDFAGNEPAPVRINNPNGGFAISTISQTPGSGAKKACVEISAETAYRIQSGWDYTDGQVDYDDDPASFERAAYRLIAENAPELNAAVAHAFASDAVVVEVHGLNVPFQTPKTPLDGRVDFRDVRTHVMQLTGAFGTGIGMGGFAYESENAGQLLRAVAPVRAFASQASSQGADDLGMHNDNANRPISVPADQHPGNQSPMNPYQAFVTVRADEATPMEVLALDDAVHETISRYGARTIQELLEPQFSVRRPDSHGGGLDVLGVPVLVLDDQGSFRSRFHASNVEGMNQEAQAAFNSFREIVLGSNHVMAFEGSPGSLLIYSNDRGLHRRRSYQPRYDGTDRYYIRTYFAPLDVINRYGRGPNHRVFA